MLGLSQRDVAERTGVKQPLLSAIESGKRRASASVEIALQEHLRVRPSVALAHYRDEAIDLIRRHRGEDAFVFGSAARGADDADSDLDLMVQFNEDADITDLLALQDELSQLLTVPVDVVSAGSSSAFVRACREDAVPL